MLTCLVTFFRDRKGTPKSFCDKDFAELSGDLSGAICLKALGLLATALEKMSPKRYFWAIFGLFFPILSANFFLFSGGGQNQYFSPFFPISGRRPENPVLAGGQGRNVSHVTMLHFQGFQGCWVVNTLASSCQHVLLYSSRGKWGNPKQHMKLQQPRNYDFWMFQFNLLGSQGGNSREMTTSPPGHY